MVLDRMLIFTGDSTEADKSIVVPPDAKEIVLEVFSNSGNAVDFQVGATLEEYEDPDLFAPLSMITLATNGESDFEITKTITADGIYSASVSGMAQLIFSNNGVVGDLVVFATLIG